MAPRDTLDVSIGIFMSFKDLGIAPALVEALDAQGITSPFPIQSATLPDAIKGRDVLGRGQTGSGKTLAFGLAMLTRLEGRTAKPHRPLGLILSPTRELAVQISDVVGPLSRKVGLSTQVVAGGLSYVGQIKALRSGVTILVATPGRLIDLIEKKHVVLDDVAITVLDEADQMADMGFLPVVKDILGQTKDDGQRLLFSATLDRDVDSLVKRFLKDPITHSLENEKSRAADMLHHVLIMDQGHKDLVATQIAAREGRTIFFVRTKHGADKLAEKMLRSGVPVGVLHGGKSQGQRTRVLAAFKDGRASALVATDVAARGIHVDDVSLVVHVDAPADHKDYLHRAGRTARAGATGVVVTLATHKQKRGIFGITNQAKVKLNEVYVRPSDPELIRVTGAQEPSGIPVIVQAEKPGRNDRGSRDRGDRGGFRRGHSGNFKKRSEGGGRVGDSEREKPVRSFRGATPEKLKYEDRPARTDRNDKFEKRGKPERSFRADRHPKAERFEKSDRPAKADRFNSQKPSKFDKSDRPVKKSYKSDSRPVTSTWRADSAQIERTEKREDKRPAFKKASGPKKFAKKAPAKRAPLPKGTFKKAGPKKNVGKSKPRVK
ncbi:MAG: DEAD/DEAH box helicase [Actinobacteria bacterium]|nr:DEAD/DEAH box helicase [Actinomycetota bacterium]MDA2981413.1 DEAD/DEAH box helicase [Actinomycetota bacterium]